MRHRWVAVAAVALSLVSAAGWAADQGKEKAAEAAALKWLSLVDDGQYGESWSQSSEVFRQAISREQWEQALRKVRTPLGKLVSRKLSSATHAVSLPGAPEGEYVVLQFATGYENKKGAIETITPMLEKDGAWRVSGYFVK
ncbi:MAG: DUF4019 domain-containing protein [Acidobacteria bacterium]|nr:DUF4019 domain-containing protein [Acidobacteriota bacterium]